MREIRRLAHLHIPKDWAPEEIVPEVRKLGFTDLYFFVNKVESGVDIGGLRLSTAMEVGRLAEREGMGVLVNTGYMKYHEQVVLAHPERRMVLRDAGAGDGSRETGSGQASGGLTAVEGRIRNVNWLCPFNEVNKRQYKNELRRLAAIPALRFVYLNDEGFLGAYGEMACYCDFCRKRFADRFGEEPPSVIDWKDPLWRNWIKWRFVQWTAVHAEFREAVRSARPNLGAGMATACTELMGMRPWASAVDLGEMSRVLDSMNTGIYHGVTRGTHRFTPRFPIVLDMASIFVGALQGKPLRLAVQAFCPGTSLEMTRKDGQWIGILPYAVGAAYVSPWCYETLRTSPAQFEGYMESLRLDRYLKETEPEIACGLFHSVQSEVWRYHDLDYDEMAIHPFARMLRDEGLPYAFVWDSRLDETDLTQNGPLVMPHVCCLSKSQKDLLTTFLEGGGGILGTADLGLYDEEGGPVDEALPSCWGVASSGDRLEGQYRLALTEACPFREDVKAPAVIENPYRVGRVEGEVWATLVDADGRDTGAPGLVASRVGDGRFVYLAGDPVVHHREPGYEPLVKLPNHTRRLIGNVIRLLASSPPWIDVEDFPPVTAYQRLRNWDRRGINTFQFLPQVGPRYAIAILASYVGAEATVPIRFRIPVGKRLSRIFNGLTDESYMAEASVDSVFVRYRLKISHADGVIPVVVEWV